MAIVTGVSIWNFQFMSTAACLPVLLFFSSFSTCQVLLTAIWSAFPATASAEVLGETRSVSVTGGVFSDSFASYGIHLYRITY